MASPPAGPEEAAARRLAEGIMSGRVPPGEGAARLRAMAARGETRAELLGFVSAVEAASVPVRVEDPGGAADVCGTGGDGLRTFNVSTAAAFLAAAAGCRVAKHGNRSSSGGTGSADVLEALGCDLSAGPEGAASSLSALGVCFMFAPRFHPSLAGAAAARRLAGGRTAFNLAGPLCNPARPGRRLVGAPSRALLRTVLSLLAARGAEAAMAVSSADGMDELSPCSRSAVLELRGGAEREYSVGPEDVGLRASPLRGMLVGSRAEAAAALVGAVDGTGARAARDAAALNAGAAVYLCGLADDLAGGVGAAAEAADSGAGADLLGRYVGRHGDPALLEAARARR